MISARRFRNRVTAGLVLVVPVWITFMLAAFVFRLLRDTSLWLIEAWLLSPAGRPVLQSWGLSAEQVQTEGLKALPWLLQWALAAAAVVLTILILYLLGGVTTNVVGRRVVHAIEALVDRVPLVKTVYRASQQVLATLAGDTTRPFRQVAMVPFPNDRVRSVGFVTREGRDPVTGEETYNVFVATTPNPTTGFMLVVRRSEVTLLDWTVEEAVKAVMSGGVLMPDRLPQPPVESEADGAA
jgi:uncharacterized membrane protein